VFNGTSLWPIVVLESSPDEEICVRSPDDEICLHFFLSKFLKSFQDSGKTVKVGLNIWAPGCSGRPAFQFQAPLIPKTKLCNHNALVDSDKLEFLDNSINIAFFSNVNNSSNGVPEKQYYFAGVVPCVTKRRQQAPDHGIDDESNVYLDSSLQSTLNEIEMTFQSKVSGAGSNIIQEARLDPNVRSMAIAVPQEILSQVSVSQPTLAAIVAEKLKNGEPAGLQDEEFLLDPADLDSARTLDIVACMEGIKRETTIK
jgi:hypothetical protein